MGKYQIFTQREMLDPETGELTTIDTSKTFTKKICEDTFYMTFIEYMSPVFGLKPDSAKQLLAWMCQHAEFNTGIVWIPSARRKEITKELGLESNTISNYLKKLKELKIITGKNGKFMVNPQIFWKGDLGTWRRFLKNKELRITFDLVDKDDPNKTGEE